MRKGFMVLAAAIMIGVTHMGWSATDDSSLRSSEKKQSIADILKNARAKHASNPKSLALDPDLAPKQSASPGSAANSAPVNPVVSLAPGKDKRLNAAAFSNTIDHVMPLSPHQIKALHESLDRSQRAASAYPSAPPKPTSASVLVGLSPGTTPPIARLSLGFVTSLVFLDATGEPWPIQAYDLGDPSSFNIQWNKKDNKLLVQALKSYKFGNLAVILKGLDTPVLITLIPGQNAVDYRLDLHIPARGPDAKMTVSGLPDTVSGALLSVLNGVPPTASKPLQILGGSGEAWLLGNHLFFRTRATLLSPAWISTLSSADGTHAYELQNTPVILVLRNGKAVNLKVEGL